MIELGDKVKDSITGLVGIVVGKVDYLYGCKHVMVQPSEKKDGKPIDSTMLDEGRVVLVKKAAVVAKAVLTAGREGSAVCRISTTRAIPSRSIPSMKRL